MPTPPDGATGPPPLPERPLGTTGLRVTALGLGTAALGRPGYLNLGHGDDLAGHRTVEGLEARAHQVLDEAWRLGVRHVDAARSYGRAEAFVASWLAARGIEPGAVVVSSKWGYTYTAGWRVDAEVHEVKDHSLATLRRQLPETEALLGPWLGLLQIHSATLESGVLDDGAVLDALAEVRDGGVAVGLTTSGPAQAEVVRRALAVDRGGEPLFGAVQSTWNVLEPSVGPALAEAHDAGRGVIVKEAVANGRLTDRGTAHDPALGRALAAVGPEGATPDQVALAAALAQPWADVVLSGAATVDQLGSNVGAVALADRVDRDALAVLARDPVRYWGERSALPWT